MLRTLSVVLLALMVSITACSDPEKEAGEAFAALESEYEAARNALLEAQHSLPGLPENPDSADLAASRAQAEAGNEEYANLKNSFEARFEDLVQAHWGTGGGLDAKLWIMTRARAPDEEENDEARKARLAAEVDSIFEAYAESTHIQKLAELNFLLPEDEADAYRRRLREDSPHAHVRAAAIFDPVQREISRLRLEAFWGEREREREADRVEETDPGEEDRSEEQADPRARIDADLQLLIDEYGDVPVDGSTYGAVAYAYLTAHTPEELAIGQPAPDIVGADVDGNELRLSDFQGKVTVFNFWGDW